MIKDISKWLRQAPKKSEIVEIQNGSNKVKIITQKVIESLLDELTEQNWSTRNFQFTRWNEIVDSMGGAIPASLVKIGRTMCDASLELVVTYRMMVPAPLHDTTGPMQVEKEITRVLVGSYSFDTALFGNEYVANTAKSLCISNAASDLGRRFGKDLNPKEAAVLILGIKKPGQVAEEAKGKIAASLDKIKVDLTKKMIG